MLPPRVYDTIELCSLDGGAWNIAIESEGSLTTRGAVENPGNAGDPGSPLDDDILEKSSGKTRQ